MNFNKSIILYLKDDELIPSEEFIFHQGDKGINVSLTIKELNGNAFYPYYSDVEVNGDVSLEFEKEESIFSKSLTVQNNVIEMIISENMTDVVGNHYLQLSVTKDSNKLYLPRCKFEVKKSIV